MLRIPIRLAITLSVTVIVGLRAVADPTSFLLLFEGANDGGVSLSGSVPEASQVDLAINAAKGVPGVQSVNSRLAVRSEIIGRGGQ
ncbi:BON domain-containing protein [Paraburkholderia sp. RAU2J]|nr:BON domain-containing protein [Paraburkholderia sp. RAU2J]